MLFSSKIFIVSSYLYNELDFHLYKATYLQVIHCVIHVSDLCVSGQTYTKFPLKLPLVNISISGILHFEAKAKNMQQLKLTILHMLKKLNIEFYKQQFTKPLLF